MEEYSHTMLPDDQKKSKRLVLDDFIWTTINIANGQFGLLRFFATKL